jgi:hypothetical protein
MNDRGKTKGPEHQETASVNGGQEQEVADFRGNSRSVPVIPNESVITGKVVSYSVTASSALNIKPDQNIYVLEIKIDSSRRVEGKRDFVKDKVGSQITCYSKEQVSSTLIDKAIRAHVAYRGDEKGRRFWIWDIEILLLDK